MESRIARSIGFSSLWALGLALLFYSPVWGQEYPKTVCDGDTCSFWHAASGAGQGQPTATYNKRGKFTVVDSAGTTKTVDQSFSLIIGNGYGDVYFLNMLRARDNYQAYRGYCSYRGFSLSGCATTGEVVVLRINGNSVMPEHISLMSTSLRWGKTMYMLNDVFRPLTSTIYAGYENWYPFDMSCSVAMYISQGGWN